MGDGDVQAKLEELKAGQVDIMKGQEAIKVMMANIPRRNYNAMSQFHDHELEVSVGVRLVGRRCCVAPMVPGVYPCLFVACSRCASSAWVARSADLAVPYLPTPNSTQSTTAEQDMCCNFALLGVHSAVFSLDVCKYTASTARATQI